MGRRIAVRRVVVEGRARPTRPLVSADDQVTGAIINTSDVRLAGVTPKVHETHPPDPFGTGSPEAIFVTTQLYHSNGASASRTRRVPHI